MSQRTHVLAQDFFDDCRNRARFKKSFTSDLLRGSFYRGMMRYQAAMYKARRFELDNQALRIALELAQDDHALIRTYCEMARLPFEHTWIEVDYQTSVPEGTSRVGWLFTQDKNDLDKWTCVTVHYLSGDKVPERAQGHTAIMPIELAFDARIATFQAFAEAMADYLVDGAIRGWVFEMAPFASAWQPTSVIYYPPEGDDPASINVAFERLRRDQVEHKSFSFGSDEAKGSSVVDVLENNGFQKETTELLELYDESLAQLQAYLPLYGKQFQLATNVGWNAKRNRYFVGSAYEEEDDEQQINLAENFQGRLIHDETDELKRTMRLLETLTTELNLVQEDIVKGKSGGNMVLLGGPPGTGKTLTMEVLAEAKQVPLFLVHSGLLGTTPDSVEKKLRNVYARAQAWGDVIVGIDEADVFVRERGDDVVQNAIVAVFLRTLEYQNGTIFMTTNRIDDIDDAIKSRASAIIKYTNPAEELKVKIWVTLSAQFLPNLDPKVVEDLVPCIQDDLSGRDIKGILRLADRYQRVGHTLDLDTMKDVAGFRGLQVV
jgi:hypothetical protein